MVRRYRRPDFRRRRRRGPPPQEGWLISELATLVGVTPRTIRYYLQKGLLPSPTFYGTATRYQRPALLRALSIRHMQRDEHLSLDAIKTRLAHMAAEEIESYALAKLTSGPAATALGVERPAMARTVATTFAEPETPPSYASVKWDVVQLLPGLSLLVKSDGSPLVKKLAQQIYDHCVGAAQPART
ncbi:Transcriptional regulator, MerR family [Labilithrix luteola]|uniref:Transcriptional regulator, MerR family n=1 Tax=Labilithrix luteola TaxID=1391654 RepID=A0A0K1PXV5_9BACT|nr:MerR family transcriptional regulator [Labilithrix luteola]AKU98360.1 Transcriptional regulator, MerR family [Labilithrix luteola]